MYRDRDTGKIRMTPGTAVQNSMEPNAEYRYDYGSDVAVFWLVGIEMTPYELQLYAARVLAQHGSEGEE